MHAERGQGAGQRTVSRAARFLTGALHPGLSLFALARAKAASSGVSNEPMPRCPPSSLTQICGWYLPELVTLTPRKPDLLLAERSGSRSGYSSADAIRFGGSTSTTSLEQHNFPRATGMGFIF